MTVLFVSDLHLDAERPGKIALFQALLAYAAGRVAALYVLGDLFEAWLGDDDETPPNDAILDALAGFSASGSALYVMRGNRDFLIGERFAARTGCRLLADPCPVTLHGAPTLLMHGDLLCTRDTAYQALRARVTDPQWQATVLARPLAERRRLAREMREGSLEHILANDDAIMDVDPDTVIATLRAHGVEHLIHGHTHRPGVHRLEIDGRPAWRTVLGDWYEDDSVLICEPGGQRLVRVVDYLAGR